MSASAIILVSFLSSTLLVTGVEISPDDATKLEAVLDFLADKHSQSQFCQSDCFTLYEASFSGSMASGELKFKIKGAVTSKQKAFIPLFATRPDTRLSSAKTKTGATIPLYWSNEAYHVALSEGPFELSGKIVTQDQSILTVSVPGPVGLLQFNISDADVVGTTARRKVSNGTFQLALRQDASDKDKSEEEKVQNLRVRIRRNYQLARDKTFDIAISAEGTKPGEVLSLPLLKGEIVDIFDRQRASLHESDEGKRIDWVTSGGKDYFGYSGRFDADTLSLLAPGGATGETWLIRCEDPWECTFEGNAEKKPGSSGHYFIPLPAQKIKVSWRALKPLSGVNTVAQHVALRSERVGKNLK
ncbi:hypothetical protein KAI87_08475, partial [Myxococcota bacterium]|nr:hypothetical protein [Myxococcota bacterium]